MAGDYAVCLIPGLLGAAGFLPLAKFMQVQGEMVPMAAIAGLALCFHVLANYLGIFWLNWGFRAAALAYSATDFVELALMVIYLKYVDRAGVLERTWSGWSLSAALQGWPSFFALAVPSASMTW